MIDYDRIQSVANELQKYAELEDTELGELCRAIIQLSRYVDYVSEEFVSTLLVEMEDQLLNFQENATIVEREETFKRTVAYLDWN